VHSRLRNSNLIHNVGDLKGIFTSTFILLPANEESAQLVRALGQVNEITKY
jgi:hypothetical protein